MQIAICDDEAAMRSELENLIRECMAGREAEYAVTSLDNAAALLAEPRWDIVFLDIQMPGTNGMEAARILRQRGFSGQIIFTTVLEEYVYDAFDVEAAGYLVKPPDKERFCRAMDRALKKLQQGGGSMVIRSGETMEIVPYSGIVYCEVHGHTVEVHTRGGRILKRRGRLEELEKEAGCEFFRCHRSYLINLAYVRSCGGGQVTMSTGDHVPMSRLREKELKTAVAAYLSKKT